MKKLLWIGVLQLAFHLAESATRFEDIDLDQNGAISFNEFTYYAERLPTLK